MMATTTVRRAVVVALCASLAAACAARAPHSFYALSVVGTPAAVDAHDLSVAVGPVSLPAYLDRPQLVERNGEHEFVVSEQHRWLEALDDGFARALAEDLGTRLGSARVTVFPSPTDRSPDYRVTVDVARFELDRASGEVRLRARWSIDGHGGGAFASGTTAGATRAESVAALSQLVGELADTVAARVRTIATAP